MPGRMLLALALSLAFGVEATAQTYVRGYVRSNGTYVQPHYRSTPDGNFWNNWSTYPNVNPYTGQMGTRQTPRYSSSYYTPSYSPSYSSYRSSSYPSYPSYNWRR